MFRVGPPTVYSLGDARGAGRVLSTAVSPDGLLTAVWTDRSLYITRGGVSLGVLATHHVTAAAAEATSTAPEELRGAAVVAWRPLPAGKRSEPPAPAASYRLALVCGGAVGFVSIGAAAVTDRPAARRTFFSWLLGDSDGEDDDDDTAASYWGGPGAGAGAAGAGDRTPLPMRLTVVLKASSGTAAFTCATASLHYLLLGRSDCVFAVVTWGGELVLEAQLEGNVAAAPDASPPWVRSISCPAVVGDADVLVVVLSSGTVVSMYMQVPASVAVRNDRPGVAAADEYKRLAPFIVPTSAAQVPVAALAPRRAMVTDLVFQLPPHGGSSLSAAADPAAPADYIPTVLLAVGCDDGSVATFRGTLILLPPSAADDAPSAAPSPDRVNALPPCRVAWALVGDARTAHASAHPPAAPAAAGGSSVATVAWRVRDAVHGGVPAGEAAMLASLCRDGSVHLWSLAGEVGGAPAARALAHHGQVYTPPGPLAGGADHHLLPAGGAAAAAASEVVALASPLARSDLSWGASGYTLVLPARHLPLPTGAAAGAAAGALATMETEGNDSDSSDGEAGGSGKPRSRLPRLPHVVALSFADTVGVPSTGTSSRSASRDAAEVHGSEWLVAEAGVMQLAMPHGGTPGAPTWRPARLSPHYADNAPLRLASVAPDGHAIAVAGARGAAIYYAKKGTWRVFSTPRQEAAVFVSHMTWVTPRVLLLVHRSERSEGGAAASAETPATPVPARTGSRLWGAPTAGAFTYELQAYPRTHLDDSMRLLSLPLSDLVGGPAAPVALSSAETVLTVDTPPPAGGAAPSSVPLPARTAWLVLAVTDAAGGGGGGGAGDGGGGGGEGGEEGGDAPRSTPQPGVTTLLYVRLHFRTSATDALPARAAPALRLTPHLVGSAPLVGGSAQDAGSEGQWGATLEDLGVMPALPGGDPNTMHQVRTLKRAGDGTVIAGTELAPLRPPAGLDAVLVATATLPREVTARGGLRSVGALATRVHLTIGNNTRDRLRDGARAVDALATSPATARGAAAGAAGGAVPSKRDQVWGRLLPRTLLHAGDGAVYLYEPASGSLRQVAAGPAAVPLVAAVTHVVPVAPWGLGTPTASALVTAADGATVTLLPAATVLGPAGEGAGDGGGAVTLHLPGEAPPSASGAAGRVDALRGSAEASCLAALAPPPGVDGVVLGPVAAAGNALLVMARDAHLPPFAAAAQPAPGEHARGPRGGSKPGSSVKAARAGDAAAGAGAVPASSPLSDGSDREGAALGGAEGSDWGAAPEGVHLLPTLHLALRPLLAVALFTPATATPPPALDAAFDAVVGLVRTVQAQRMPFLAAALASLLHEAVDAAACAAPLPPLAAVGDGATGLPALTSPVRRRLSAVRSGGAAAAASRALAAVPGAPLSVGGAMVDLHRGVAPAAMKLLHVLAGALREYLAGHRIPSAAVFGEDAPPAPAPTADGAPEALPAPASSAGALLAATVALLRQLDVHLETVAAVGRAGEEGLLPTLLPTAGSPRSLFHEALHRAAVAAGTVVGAPVHTPASLRFIKVAAAYVLLIQEHAWRTRALGSVERPASEADITDVVNDNLRDARQLMAACGLTPLQASALVGPVLPPLMDDGGAAAMRLPVILADATRDAIAVSLATAARSNAGVCAALASVVDNAHAYCNRLRSAAVDNVLAARAAAGTGVASAGAAACGGGKGGGRGAPSAAASSGGWSLVGAVASLFGFGQSKEGGGEGGEGGDAGGAASDAAGGAAAVESDPVLRVMAGCTLPVLVDVATMIHRTGGAAAHGAGAFGIHAVPVNRAAVVAGGGPGIPPDLGLPAAAASNAAAAGEVSAVVAVLERVGTAQAEWLSAQLLDAVVCVGGVSPRRPTGVAPHPNVGDVVVAVDGRPATGVSYDAAVATFDSAPRDAPLALARVVSLPLLRLLGHPLLAGPTA